MAETVLHAEVGHGGALLVRLHVHVGTELGIDFVHTGHDFLVGSQGLELFPVHA